MALGVDLKSLLERQSRPFLIVNAAGTLFRVNHALETFLGYEIGGLKRLKGNPDAQARHQRFFHDLEPFVEHRTLRASDGKDLAVRVQGFPLLDTDGALYLGESVRPLCSAADDDQMLGDSAALQTLRERLVQAAATGAPVLLQGETGAGKELAARHLHKLSPRADKPFVVVDCTVLTEDLFETELFGHIKGSFTGASSNKTGLFELADGGTLFLDEIGELPLSHQPKLLRALETGSFRPLGATSMRNVDIRLVCATHQDLNALIQKGGFRQDLYYRLAVLPLRIPPLRERREDIPTLARHLLGQIHAADDQVFRLTRDALIKLLRYEYPGNIRELRNLLFLAATLSPGGDIDAKFIQLPSGGSDASSGITAPQNTGPRPVGRSPVETAECEYIEGLLQRHSGSRKLVAASMNISERTLYRKMKRYGLSRIL